MTTTDERPVTSNSPSPARKSFAPDNHKTYEVKRTVDVLIRDFGMSKEALHDGEVQLTKRERHVVRLVLDRHNWRSLACPSWCGGARWHGLESLEDRLEDSRVIVHSLSTGGGWLPEVRRCATNVTRERVGTWEVRCHSDAAPYTGEAVSDSVVRLRIGGDGDREVSLLPGEARSIAAGLVAAADRLDGVAARRSCEG